MGSVGYNEVKRKELIHWFTCCYTALAADLVLHDEDRHTVLHVLQFEDIFSWLYLSFLLLFAASESPAFSLWHIMSWTHRSPTLLSHLTFTQGFGAVSASIRGNTEQILLHFQGVCMERQGGIKGHQSHFEQVVWKRLLYLKRWTESARTHFLLLLDVSDQSRRRRPASKGWPHLSA